MTDFKDIKVILFDIDNTLLDFKECARGAMIKAFNTWKEPFKEEYLPVFMEINNKYWTMYENGEITRDYLYAHRWQEIFDILGIKLDGKAFEQDFIKNLYTSAFKVNHADELLSYLNGRYILGIISNSSLDEQTERLRRAGLLNYFSHIFTSEELGIAKPDYRFFEIVHNSIDKSIPKEEILVVGDSLNADISGGHNYGFRTAWFNIHDNSKSDLADFTFYELPQLREKL